MDVLFFAIELVRNPVFHPFRMADEVASGEEPSLVLLVVDVILIIVKEDFGLTVFHQLVDDMLLGGG